jgi:hypothetical protein
LQPVRPFAQGPQQGGGAIEGDDRVAFRGKVKRDSARARTDVEQLPWVLAG